MPSNVGTQIVTLKFYDSAATSNVNRRQKGIISTGIYSGGYLTKKDDSNVYLSLLVCEIQSGTGDHIGDQVRVETQSVVTVAGCSSASPYIVLRWTYTGNQSADYMDFGSGCTAVSSPGSYDLIVGKCSYSGATLQGFDYTQRSNPNATNLFLRVEPEQTPAMYVRVRAGVVQVESGVIQISDQLAGPFTAPGSGTTTGAVYIDSNGAVQISSNFTYAGQLVLAEIALSVGQSTITSSNITDVRPFLTASGGSIYDSGWFAVVKNTAYIKTHNLGSPFLSITIFFAPDSGGSPDLTNIMKIDDTTYSSTNQVGCLIFKITNTQFTVQTEGNYVGGTSLTNHLTSGWYRVIAQRLV